MTVPVLFDRVEEGTSTTGTGNLTLTGAATGARTFNGVVPSGSTVEFGIDDGAGNWEISQGIFVSPSTLSRDIVLSSSNAGNAVSFGAGTKDVYLTISSSTLRKLTGLRVVTQTANYTLAAADMDNNTLILMNSANATVLTIPTNANVPAAANTSVMVSRSGNGSVTIAAAANVTVQAANATLTLRAQYSQAALTQIVADTWRAFGDLG